MHLHKKNYWYRIPACGKDRGLVYCSEDKCFRAMPHRAAPCPLTVCGSVGSLSFFFFSPFRRKQTKGLKPKIGVPTPIFFEPFICDTCKKSEVMIATSPLAQMVALSAIGAELESRQEQLQKELDALKADARAQEATWQGLDRRNVGAQETMKRFLRREGNGDGGNGDGGCGVT